MPLNCESLGELRSYARPGNIMKGPAKKFCNDDVFTFMDSDMNYVNPYGIGSERIRIKCTVPCGLQCVRGDDSGSFDGQWTGVICSNRLCDQSGLMHIECAAKWEASLASALAAQNPAIGSWTKQQTSSFLWANKGFALVPGLCTCTCRQGTLFRCTENVQERPSLTDSENSRDFWQSRRGSERFEGDSADTLSMHDSSGYGSFYGGSISSAGYKKKSRSRAISASHNGFQSIALPRNSFERTGSWSTVESPRSGPNNLGIGLSNFGPLTEEGIVGSFNRLSMNNQYGESPRGNIDMNNRQRHKSASVPNNSQNDSSDKPLLVHRRSMPGNIFQSRKDYSSFMAVPFFKQNSYYIQMEDDSCTGNDDTKVYLMNHLTHQSVTSVPCVLCSKMITVYDHMPLIDGTFFISPLSYSKESSVPIPWTDLPPGTLPYNPAGHPSHKYLHAVCMTCMHGVATTCKGCHKPWTGIQLLIGGLYTHDIFAAAPCCFDRLRCKSCGKLPVDAENNPVRHFSHFSRLLDCVNCNSRDFHFVKPIQQMFEIACKA